MSQFTDRTPDRTPNRTPDRISNRPAVRALSTELVHRMVAGEVIDSSAAVVRELLENSIDAGATRIIISLWLSQWKIDIADNGIGIGIEDLKIIAQPHTTHKISNPEDLLSIRTLGFRGEALHSLKQVAQLEILSRPIESAIGWQANYRSDRPEPLVKEVAIATGTIVKVQDLFQTWEARRSVALKQQIKQIQACIQNIALAHPAITIQVYQDDREWLLFSGTKTLTERLLQMLPQKHRSDFREIKRPHLHLLLGLPDRISRRSPDWLRVAINGRFVNCPELYHTLTQGLRRMVPRDRYPVAIAHFTLRSEQIDWTRTPNKTELYINPLEPWEALLGETIQDCLQLQDALPSSRTTDFLLAAEQRAPYNTTADTQNLATDLHTDSQPSQRDASDRASDRRLPNALTAIAQVRNTYILAEHSGGLYLVEQHIAHERILYEELCDRWQLVPLEPALSLSGLQARQVEQLEAIGITIEAFGEQLWIVRSIPALLAEREDCAAALLELSHCSDLQTAQVAIACRSAIRNGTPLPLPQLQDILDRWQRTTNPHTCPHGRPIYLILEETALARFFRRSWVIGKSHGLA